MNAEPVRVAGVTRASAMYPWALLALAQEVRAGGVDPVEQVGLWDEPVPASETRVPVDLVREPGNRRDPNAVRVEVPVLEDAFGHHRHVGWVPAETARVFAPRMDGGAVPVAWVRSIPIGSPADMRPGLVVWVAWPAL